MAAINVYTPALLKINLVKEDTGLDRESAQIMEINTASQSRVETRKALWSVRV